MLSIVFVGIKYSFCNLYKSNEMECCTPIIRTLTILKRFSTKSLRIFYLYYFKKKNLPFPKGFLQIKL